MSDSTSVQSNSSVARPAPIATVEERHFTIAQISKMWALSEDAVRRLFRREPGVLVFGDTNPRRRKRRYVTLRIPQSVLERVHRQYALGK
jgi:hypothetical protein